MDGGGLLEGQSLHKDEGTRKSEDIKFQFRGGNSDSGFDYTEGFRESSTLT